MEISANYLIDLLRASKPIELSKIIAISNSYGLSPEDAIQFFNNIKVAFYNDVFEMDKKIHSIGSKEESKWIEELKAMFKDNAERISIESSILFEGKKGSAYCYLISVKDSGNDIPLIFHPNKTQQLPQLSMQIVELIATMINRQEEEEEEEEGEE